MYHELADFMAFCRVERRLSPETCRGYEADVRRCLEHLESSAITDLVAITVMDLRRFLVSEANTRPAPSSQARTVAALKSFFRFCVESEYLVRDPALPLRTPKKREALPDVLDRQELRRLLAAPTLPGVWQREFRGRRERDTLMLAMFAYAGLRRSELLGLDWDDLDLQRRLIRVRVAKGGWQRVVPLHSALVPLIADWWSVRGEDGQPAVFTGAHGGRMTATLLTRTFRRYTAASGVDRRKVVTPHTLRHVFASELLAAGANLRQIQELLGHKHLDSTQRYTRVTAHQLRGAIKRLHFDHP